MRRATLAPLLLLMIAAPVVGDYEPGTAVDKPDHDYFPTPKFDDTALCFRDHDGDGRVGVDEPLFLRYKSTTCGTVNTKDVRLTASSAGPQGSQVKTWEEEDYGKPLTAVPEHAVRFFDASPDAKFTKKDTMYVDLYQVDAARVGPGDLRLMPFGGLLAFSRVQADDADVNMPLMELKGAVGDDVGADAVADAQIGEAGVVFWAGKGLYVNADGSAGDTVIEEGDVRLTKVPTPWGEIQQAVTGAPTLEIVDRRESTDTGFRLITTVVRNAGDVTGSGLLETSISGIVVDARGTPTLAPGDEATLVIALPLASASTATAAAGSTVAAMQGPVDGDAHTPGLGAAMLAIALVGAVVLARRN